MGYVRRSRGAKMSKFILDCEFPTEYFDNHVDEKGNVDNKLSLTSEGFQQLTYDIEELVDKYTGVEDSSFMKCAEIRLDVMDLIHSIINKEE